MPQELIFAIISTLLYFVGFVPYIYHVFHGRVVPHPFSWTIWFIFGAINLAILLQVNGSTWSIIPMIGRTLALFVGLICGWLMIRKIKISQFDYLSLLLAIGVIVFMYVYGMTEAVIAMVIVDILVLFPTLHKIWTDPRTEDALVWFTSSLSQACLLISLPFFTFENSFYWFYAIAINISVGLFIRLRLRFLTNRWYYKIATMLHFRN